MWIKIEDSFEEIQKFKKKRKEKGFKTNTEAFRERYREIKNE